MDLQIIKMNNPRFTKLLAFDVNEKHLRGNLVDVECFMLYEYGVCTLESYMNIEGIKKWSEEDALGFLREIVITVDSLHEKGIVLLDIKPANIVIDEKMKSFKLIDYGCSYKLPKTDLEKLNKTPACRTKKNTSDEMLKSKDIGLSEIVFYAYK